jgi:zinc transporter ZupT
VSSYRSFFKDKLTIRDKSGLVTTSLVPLTAGGFVYLAAADLIPELQHDHSLRALVVQTFFTTLGIVIMGQRIGEKYLLGLDCFVCAAATF